MTQDKDFKEVLLEERRRGRRPIDIGARQKGVQRLAEMRKLLMLGTEEEFRKAMRAFGMREGSQQFLDALDAWHQFRP